MAFHLRDGRISRAAQHPHGQAYSVRSGSRRAPAFCRQESAREQDAARPCAVHPPCPWGPAMGNPKNRNRHIGAQLRLASVGILHRSRYKTSLRRSMPPAPECLPENHAFSGSRSAAPRLSGNSSDLPKPTRRTPIQAAEQPFRTAPYMR